MARLPTILLVVCCLCSGSQAVSSRKFLSSSAAVVGEVKFWPFTSAAEPAAPKPVVAKKPEAPPARRVQDAKQALMMSVAFKKKTEMLCAAAAADVQEECQSLAKERLFCTMFSRHADKFKGMIGEQEQKERCSRTDIMETVADAAKDLKEKEDAAADEAAPQ